MWALTAAIWVGSGESCSFLEWVAWQGRQRSRGLQGPPAHGPSELTIPGGVRPTGRAPLRERPRIHGDEATRCGSVCTSWGTTPHTRGRHPQGPDVVRGDGNNPHARGRHRRARRYVRGHGNNPARAGTTPATCLRWTATGEQPRTRGDDKTGWVREPRGKGTAPHARGRRLLDERVGVGYGNSPARAGTTPPTLPEQRRDQEQPRTRGDDSR